MAKPTIEKRYTDCLRIIKRLWEHLNSIDCLVSDLDGNRRVISEIHRFPNILQISPKTVNRAEMVESAEILRSSLIWRWGLIVSITYFDAWIEDLVTLMHQAYPELIPIAKSRKYNFKTPSFSTDFFIKDKASIGLSFAQNDKLLLEFIKWKETRNCLVHKGGRVDSRLAVLFQPHAKVGSRVTVSSSEAREAFAAIMRMVKEIQKHVRKQSKARYQLRNSPPSYGGKQS